jgi:hypothetical protein
VSLPALFRILATSSARWLSPKDAAPESDFSGFKIFY